MKNLIPPKSWKYWHLNIPQPKALTTKDQLTLKMRINKRGPGSWCQLYEELSPLWPGPFTSPCLWGLSTLCVQNCSLLFSSGPNSLTSTSLTTTSLHIHTTTDMWLDKDVETLRNSIFSRLGNWHIVVFFKIKTTSCCCRPPRHTTF